MFEKTLQDIVKEIRSYSANKDALDTYVSNELQRIKIELKKSDNRTKANAVSKLTYIKMLGFDTSWAAFHIIEVMSIQRFKYKRVGYLAATQTFPQNQELVLLCTNLLKKDLHSKHSFAIGTAVNCVANIMDRDLARDLLDDLVSMMTSSQVYVRKKAVLVMYKAFEKYPQGLRLVFANLKKKLLDDDVSVVSCAVNVVCELARKRPKNYISLVPVFFTLLQNASNNWMLIKVVKLLGTLMSEEPRLAKKALGPLCNIIQTTPAKSLMYECINTATIALSHLLATEGETPANLLRVVNLCTDKLQSFLSDPDQNLKYLGLVGLSSMMASYPTAVARHRAVILGCLRDEDMTIRLRALNLLCGMITKRNIVEVVRKLMRHAATSDDVYRDAVVEKILWVCSKDRYAYVNDFAWYVSILIELINVNNGSFGGPIAIQLIDICMRVASVRSFVATEIAQILTDGRLLNGPIRDDDAGMVNVLVAAAFIVGEYSSMLGVDQGESSGNEECKGGIDTNISHCKLLMQTLLCPRTLKLPSTVQGSFIQSVLKIVLNFLQTPDFIPSTQLDEFVQVALPLSLPFASSAHIEVQERGVALKAILGHVRSTMSKSTGPGSYVTIASALRAVHAEELKAVHPKAQDSVPLPEGLDLNTWINADEAAAEKFAQNFVTDEVRFCPKQTGYTCFAATPNKIPSVSQEVTREVGKFHENEWDFLDPKDGERGSLSLKSKQEKLGDDYKKRDKIPLPFIANRLTQTGTGNYIVAKDYAMPVNLTAKGTPQVEKRRRSSSTLSDDVCLGDISLDDDTKSRLRKRKKEKKSRKNKAKKANAPTHGKKKKKKQKKRKE